MRAIAKTVLLLVCVGAVGVWSWDGSRAHVNLETENDVCWELCHIAPSAMSLEQVAAFSDAHCSCRQR